MLKREFFESIVIGIKLLDNTVTIHTNTDAYGNVIQVSAYKPYDSSKNTKSKNKITVRCKNNVVSILVDYKLVSEIDWNKAYKPNMVALTIDRVLELIK